jgi:predicted regulator of Ras-like GTPase activity (Roadblock/LC7/MglB family)
MVKKKTRSQQENSTTVVVDDDELVAAPKEDEAYTDLSNKLAEIRKDKDVIGYILRSTTSATIDLKEPEKIVEYAIFSSQVLESSQEIADLYELDDIKSVLVEGKENKALCMDIDGNKISIFMEKTADHDDILKKISP